ncbi:MAG: YdcF family protein [Chloroflexi bacterium]|nr:MAG: YdcF family protein [Chloroflexota bacterium]
MRSDPRATSDGDGDLAGFPEVAVVLGGGFSANGEPSASTVARARAAAHLAQKRPTLAVIASGSHGDGPAPAKSEAAIIADLIAATGVPRDRLFLEERSRDTIGNAVEVVARYLRGVEARPIYLVTSPFHLERALVTFRHVLGFEWQVQAVAAEDTDDDRKRANSETAYLQETFAFFEGIRPGDMAAIDKKYRARQVR